MTRGISRKGLRIRRRKDYKENEKMKDKPRKRRSGFRIKRKGMVKDMEKTEWGLNKRKGLMRKRIE